MPKPPLSPKHSKKSKTTILSSTGSAAVSSAEDVATAAATANYTLGIYADTDSALYDSNFVSGAADQVTYTFKKLGGDVLDIELTPGNIYAAYEEAVLEYSYQINIHQAKNVLSDLLGWSTGTFDHNGQMTGSDASGSSVNLAWPRYEFQYAKRIAAGVSKEGGLGGNQTIYSASFALSANVQDYDLQQIISSSAATSGYTGTDPATGKVTEFAGLIGTGSINKISVRRVFYKTPQSMWRFYGYYGGLNVVGNMNYYGQFSDDTTFEIIPAWHNKLQAMAYEDHLFTRLSHYSYEIYNNKLRIFPIPQGFIPHMWIQFMIDKDPWEQDNDRKFGADGINNVNTLPFENIPYKNINAIGKHWIRQYALALTTGILAQVRGKFSTIPIPGESVTLNAGDLATLSANSVVALKEELKTILDQMTYKALAEQDAAQTTATNKVLETVPLLIYQG
tara:strand:- start:2820 stop:4169 length:1350 start_codon:yes stop_codon:yes gene_type:complete